MSDSTSILAYLNDRLCALADPERALKMASYMKTDMPFFGVPSPERKSIFRDAKKTFPISDNDTYRDIVFALWKSPHREEKYIAIDFAQAYKKFITFENMDLPVDIIAFLNEQKNELSGLSFREASRILIKNGQYIK